MNIEVLNSPLEEDYGRNEKNARAESILVIICIYMEMSN
jgi:hypothetical protein